MPVDRHHLWYLPPAFFSAGGPWVRPSPGIPCALCILARDKLIADLGHHVPRERERVPWAVGCISWNVDPGIACQWNANSSLKRHCERSEAIQVLSVARLWVASLRSQ